MSKLEYPNNIIIFFLVYYFIFCCYNAYKTLQIILYILFSQEIDYLKFKAPLFSNLYTRWFNRIHIKKLRAMLLKLELSIEEDEYSTMIKNNLEFTLLKIDLIKRFEINKLKKRTRVTDEIIKFYRFKRDCEDYRSKN